MMQIKQLFKFMKIINLFFIFFFYLSFSTTLLSQNKEIDSLANELSLHTKKDTIRVNLLNTLSNKYRKHNISKATETSIKAKNLAKALDYKKGLAKNALIISRIHISEGAFDKAFEEAIKSLNLYKQIPNFSHKDVIPVYNTLGMISNYKNDSDKALDYFNKGLSLAKENGDRKNQAIMLNSIGITSYMKGDLVDAINYYKRSIALNEALGNSKGSLSTINNLAVICSIQGKYTEALEYYNKILIIYREDNNKKKIASTAHNIGIIYSEIEQHEKAYTYFEESLKLNREFEEKLNIAKSLNSIGSVLVDLKDYEKGLDCLNEALSLNKEINNIESLISSYNAIGQVHLLLEQPNLALNNLKSSLNLGLTVGDKRNIGGSHVNLAEVYFTLKDYSKALLHAKIGKEIVDDLDMLQEQKQINNILSNIYEAKGKFKKSLDYFKHYKILNDSLFNKENIEKITQLEYEYKYKQALDSASIRELKLTKTVTSTSLDLEKSQRNYLLAIIGFLIISILFGAFVYYQKFKNIKSKNQNIITEQKLLRSQMTPHFIFNSLSVLQGMILNKEDKKAVFYLSKFSKLLRIILENSRDQIVLLDEELEAVSNYLELQNLEESEAFQYTILVDETIDTKLFKVPPMLIQPFIENAVEHAFKNQNENQRIDIWLKYVNKELICTITDNGIGIDAEIEHKKTNKISLATTITSERLKVLSKDFKMEGSISIEDRQKYNEQGTLVTLVIPYKIELV